MGQHMQNHWCNPSTFPILPLQDTKCIARSPLSFPYQVFESVETVDQIETEPRAEEGEVQHSSPLTDITSGAADVPQLPPSSPSSPGLSKQRPGPESVVGSATSEEASEVVQEKTTTGSELGAEDVMDQVAKDEVSETKMETEGEVVKDCTVK